MFQWKNNSSCWFLREEFSLPNIPRFVGGVKLQVISWNAGGICFVDSNARERVSHHILKLARNCRVLYFQEVRGLPGEIDHHFPQVPTGWTIFTSSCLSGDGNAVANSGGIVIAICKLLVLTQCSFVEEVIIPGRCIGVCILKRDHAMSN